MSLQEYINYLKPMQINFKVYSGRSFIKQIQLKDAGYVYKQITGVSKSAPVKIASQNHEIPHGWEVSLSGIRGMKELNTDTEYNASVINKDLIEINSINSSMYQDYLGGGTIKYIKPFNFTGFTPRLTLLNSDSNIVPLSKKDVVALNSYTNTLDIVLCQETTSDGTYNRYKLDIYNQDLVLPVSSGLIIRFRG